MTLQVFKCFQLTKNRRLKFNMMTHKCTFYALMREKVTTAVFDNQNIFVWPKVGHRGCNFFTHQCLKRTHVRNHFKF